MNSLSYHLYPNQYKYIFITNLDIHFNLDLVLPIICGKKQTDKSLKQTMITIEDDGQKEIIEKEVKLDIKVDKSFSNKMIIAPLIMENNLVDTHFGKAFYFDFTYHSKSKIWIIVLAIVLPLIAIIIVGLIIYFKKRKKIQIKILMKIIIYLKN